MRDIFCHRRKVLRGVLVRLAGGKQQPAAVAAVDALYATLGLDASIRAEDISPDRFVELEREFYRLSAP